MQRNYFVSSIICLSILSISNTPAIADHPSVGLTTGKAAPIITTTATTLTKNQWSIGVQVETNDLNAISERRLIENAEANEDSDVHSVSTVKQYSLNIAKGLTDNFTIAAQLPYVKRTNIKEAHHEAGDTEIEKLGDAEGIGDARLFGQYRFMHNESIQQSAAVIFGIKLPTGETNERSPEEKLEAELQPGSGSWDPLLGFAFSKNCNNIAIDTNVIYQLVTEGTQDTDLGDFVGANLALSHQLNSKSEHQHDHLHMQWDVILELNAEWREKEDIDGITNDDSGGLLTFLSPGLRLTTTNGLSAAISVGIPVIEDLNGLQSDPQYRVSANASISF